MVEARLRAHTGELYLNSGWVRRGGSESDPELRDFEGFDVFLAGRPTGNWSGNFVPLISDSLFLFRYSTCQIGLRLIEHSNGTLGMNKRG
jgi:hypothetical protein